VSNSPPAILHTIFFHRYFIPITPTTRELLDISLPTVEDNELETHIDQKATSLVRAVEVQPSSSSPKSPRTYGQSGRAQITVSFFELKKRKKAYFFSKADEEVCWETWTLDVTCATPRTESGKKLCQNDYHPSADMDRIDAAKVRRAMEKSLHKTAMKIINIVNRDKDHIPVITTTDTNPFPYTITVNPR
jgi:autophagy-related protein 101